MIARRSTSGLLHKRWSLRYVYERDSKVLFIALKDLATECRLMKIQDRHRRCLRSGPTVLAPGAGINLHAVFAALLCPCNLVIRSRFHAYQYEPALETRQPCFSRSLNRSMYRGRSFSHARSVPSSRDVFHAFKSPGTAL